jgi:hypothetical protein
MKPVLNPAAITTPLVTERHRDAYNAEIGTDKPFARPDVPRHTAIELATCDGYAQGRRAPDLVRFLRLCRLLGPRYANRVLALAGLGEARI